MDFEQLVKDRGLTWVEIEPYSGPSQAEAFEVRGGFEAFLTAAAACQERLVFVETHPWTGAAEFVVEDDHGDSVDLLPIDPALREFLFREGQAASRTFTALCGGRSLVFEHQEDWAGEILVRTEQALERWRSDQPSRDAARQVKIAQRRAEQDRQAEEQMLVLEVDEKFINLCLVPRVSILALEQRYYEVFPKGQPNVRYHLRLLSDKVRVNHGKKPFTPRTPKLTAEE